MADLITNIDNSGLGRTNINIVFSGQATFNSIQAITLGCTPIPLTDDTTIWWDYSAGSTAQVTLSGNRSLLIYNVTNGSNGTLIVSQDAFGGRSLALVGGINKTVSGGTGSVTLSSAPNAVDILTFFYDGLAFYWNIENNFT
jgi:hypothetical protein